MDERMGSGGRGARAGAAAVRGALGAGRRFGLRALCLAPAALACLALGCEQQGEAAAGERAGALGASAGGEAAAGERAGALGASAGGEALDVERYDLVGEFDWAQNRLYAAVTVTLSAERTPPETVVLDARVAAVTGVRAPSGEALPFHYDAGAGALSVELGAGARPGAAFVVDYEAATPYGSSLFGSTPLTMITARDGDPNPARVVYTFSEPESARAWLPSHDDPADGAFFSVDLRVGAGERLIANGDLVEDTTGDCGGEGRMKYATSYPIATYLMAFALGEFEVEERRGPHGLPLSVWHRRGYDGDYRRALHDLDDLVGRFEALTGVAYPYEKYALVLVPDFFGGEEHASISFQVENGSNQPDLSNDNVLNAHELAHQWFGDLVTVATWDDLWIKEGMASLLEWEGTRGRLDRDRAGLLAGESRGVVAGDAVRDPSLPPSQKYTSGPYDRAAWVLTQVRAIAGEAAFWGALRGVLTDHRFGAVGTDEFLEAFRPALGDAGVAAVRRAVDAKALPSLAIEAVEGGARVTLADPEGALLAPMQIVWHRQGGAVETLTLGPGAPVDLVRRAPGDLLVIDPLDVHPAWARFFDGPASAAAYEAALAPLKLPTTAAQRERFLEIGGTHQMVALLEGALPAMEPSDFHDFLHELDSDAARATAVARACEVARREGGPWAHVARAALKRRPFFAGLGLAPPTYAACAELAPPEELFAGEWRALERGLAKPVLSETEVEYLLKFPTRPSEMLAAWSAAAADGYSTRVRARSAFALASFAATPGALGDADRPAWRARAAELLAATRVPATAFPLIFLQGRVAGPAAADNAAAIAALAGVLRAPVMTVTHAFAGCTAFALTANDASAWQAFAASLAGAELSPPIRALLQDPAAFCGG